MHSTVQMPLALVPEGALVEVVAYSPNVGRGFMHKVTALGLIPGAIIKVIRNHFPGPIMLDIKGFRIFIGHGIANKILVRVIG
ncbi:MAG: ferrous iron transport protein A [Candidatus Odinarchaeota archaeon]|nr:ferrous iron transport protein A [Candidatus Odinarchaeota archaeon]